MRSPEMPMILSEFIIFNDEHENGKVSGLRGQEKRNGEMRMILFFLRPDTLDLRPYFRRSAKSPNSGNSKRSPCQPLSYRTIHRNNMAYQIRSPNSRNTRAGATFERHSAA